MIELIPDRPALCLDQDCSLDLLIRITPPLPECDRERLPLNLALVIDRSGSMAGQRISLAKEAAKLVTTQLAASDYLSLILFDDRVDILLPSTQVQDKERIVRLIDGFQVRGSTALFDGWKAGAGQALLGQTEENLSRVILLTDGQANVGETNPDSICHEVHRQSERSVQTTTIGFGGGYNENLLRSMAASGEGNHFFVETPEQLPAFFELELDGLNATLGTRVRLLLRAQQEGLTFEPLGEVQRTAQGDFMLADLVAGFPLEQLIRLRVPASLEVSSPLTVEMVYYSPSERCQQSWQCQLELPRVSFQERMAMPLHPQVETQLAIAMAAKARREATEAANRGDLASAQSLLQKAIDSQSLPELEKGQLRNMQSTLTRGDVSSVNKQSVAISHAYSRGSVSLTNFDDMLLQSMVGTSIQLVNGAWHTQAPPGDDRPWSRAEGMLTGLVAGEALCGGTGEQASLAFHSLAFMGQRPKLMPILNSLAKALAGAPVSHPSAAFSAFRNRFNQGINFFEAGVEAPEAGAIARIAPLMLARWYKSSPAAWAFVVVGAHLTHHDAAAAAANVAYCELLWDLATLPAPPPSKHYAEVFLSKLRQVECDHEYLPRVPHFADRKGRLAEYCEHLLAQARRRGLSLDQARDEWGRTEYILEIIPTFLYALELHAHQPRQALAQLGQGGVLGALVGAALGALHGCLPEWRVSEVWVQEMESLRKRIYGT